MIRAASLFLILILFFACSPNPEPTSKDKPSTITTPSISYTIGNSYPHDTNSFTEGLLIHEGRLYESTGATPGLPQTKSLFGTVNLKTGVIEPKVELDGGKYFGEGISFLGGKVFQLTYQTRIGFVYDAKTFKKIREFTLPGAEGWGLTTDGTSLIMSDGTNVLTFLNPQTLQPEKIISVTENGYSLDYLNELEYINGYIFANVWMTSRIVKIDLSTGHVVGELDLTSMANDAKFIYAGSLEMNGIAYDAVGKKLYITGKMWPKIYEIKPADM